MLFGFDYYQFDAAKFDEVIQAIGLSDDASLTDTLRINSAIKKSEAISALDTLSNKIKMLSVENLAVLDDISGRMFVSCAEMVALIDSAMKLSRIVSADDMAAIDANYIRIGSSGTSGTIGVADDLTSKGIMPAVSDSIAVLEGMSKAVYGYNMDMASLADSLSCAADASRADTLSMLDNIATKIARGETNDAVSLADDLIAKYSNVAGDATALGDIIRARAGIAIDDDISTSEALVALVGKSVFEMSDLLDSIKALARDSNGDSTEATDAMGVKSAKIFDDTIAIADAISMALTYSRGHDEQASLGDSMVPALMMQRLFEDIVGLADEMSKSANKAIGDNSSANDAVAAAAEASMADSLCTSDEASLDAQAKLLDAINLISNLASMAGSGNNDTSNASDSVTAALSMFRETSDMLSAVDALKVLLQSIIDDMLLVSDEAYFAMQSARQEAIDIAEALGIMAGIDAGGDMVGAIDEKYIKALTGFGEMPQSLADKIEGRKIRVLQQVFIQGVQVPAAGLTISHSAGSRVSSCSFAIHSPSEQVLRLAVQGADVKVYMADGEGVTDYFGGRISENPVSSRSAVATEIMITADDYTADSRNIYVGEVYNESDGTLSEYIKYMWGKYYEHDIDLSKVEYTDKRADVLIFNYDTLFDATERIAQLLGWVWFVEWGPAGLALRFYPPSSAIKPVTLSHANANIAAKTCKFGQSGGIINSVYVFGGEGQSAAYTDRQLADGQKLTYMLQNKPYRANEEVGVTLSVDSVPKTLGVLNLHDPESFDALMDYNERKIIFKETSKPPKDAVVEAVYSYRYPIIMHVTDSESIRQYGVRESKVYDNKIKSAKAAKEYATSIIRDSALPKGYGSCEVYVEGLRAGDFVTVDLPTYNARGLFEITEIKKWIQSGKIKRQVQLNVADNPENRIAERLKEFAARLNMLESSQMSENTTVQRYVSTGIKSVSVKARANASGFIKELGYSESTASECYVIAHGHAAGTDAYIYDAVPKISDRLKMKPKLKPEETLLTFDFAVVGMTFLDKSRFDDNAGFGQEVGA